MQAQARDRSTSSIRRTNHTPATTAATAVRGLDEPVQTLIAVTGPVQTMHVATDPDSSAAAAASFAIAARATAAKGVRCALILLPDFGRNDVLDCRHLPAKRTCYSRSQPRPLGLWEEHTLSPRRSCPAATAAAGGALHTGDELSFASRKQQRRSPRIVRSC